MPTLHLQRNPLRAAILATLSLAPAVYAAPVIRGSAVDASESLVNTFTTSAQLSAGVARDAAGDSVVVWIGDRQISSAGTYEVFAQRYDAAGKPAGSEFLVNTFTSTFQVAPAVAMDAAGDFVVVWQSYDHAAAYSAFDIYARQYNAAGTALQTSEFLVNTFTSGRQLDPNVAMDAAGDFVVAWESYNQATSNSGIDVYARQYNAMGTASQPSEFLVNTVTDGHESLPAVAMDAAGDFAVTWEAYSQAGAYSGFDIYARQFNKAGTAIQGSEFLVNTATDTQQDAPKVAMDAAGDFVVAWQNYHSSSSNLYDVYARVYDATGSALQTSQFLVNTVTSGTQSFPAVTMDASGDFVVAWTAYNQASSTNGYDVYTRRFQGPETVDLGATLASTPGNVSPDGSFTLSLGLNNKAAASTLSNSTLAANLGNASGISVVFTLPASVTFNQATGNNWSCGSVGGTSLSCSYTGTLAAATAAPALSLDFTAPTSTDSLTFNAAVTASIQQTHSDATGNSATTTVTPTGGGSSGGGSSGGGSGSGSGGGSTGGVSGGGSSGGGGSSTAGNSGGSSGGGAFDLLSLALLGLPLLRRRQAMR